MKSNGRGGRWRTPGRSTSIVPAVFPRPIKWFLHILCSLDSPTHVAGLLLCDAEAELPRQVFVNSKFALFLRAKIARNSKWECALYVVCAMTCQGCWEGYASWDAVRITAVSVTSCLRWHGVVRLYCRPITAYPRSHTTSRPLLPIVARASYIHFPRSCFVPIFTYCTSCGIDLT